MVNAATSETVYEPVPYWAKLPHPMFFKEATSVAVDSNDNVYVFNRGDHPLMIFDRDGNFLETWGAGEFVRPHGITIDADDNLYLADDDGTPLLGEQVAIVRYEPTEIEVVVSAEREATVVLAEAMSEQWSVLVDGKEAAPNTSERLWRAVDIPAGEHTVVWRYRSNATRAAIGLTILGLVLVVILLWRPGLLGVIFKLLPRAGR